MKRALGRLHYSRWICLGLLALLGLVQSGCTHGSKVRLGGGEGYAPVPLAHVALLVEPPKREFDEIGLVKASGAGLASRTSVYRKLQKSAADMGADAVIIRNESQCYRLAGKKAKRPTPTHQAKLVHWHLIYRVPLNWAAIPTETVQEACTKFHYTLDQWQRQAAAFGL